MLRFGFSRCWISSQTNLLSPQFPQAGGPSLNHPTLPNSRSPKSLCYSTHSDSPALVWVFGPSNWACRNVQSHRVSSRCNFSCPANGLNQYFFASTPGPVAYLLSAAAFGAFGYLADGWEISQREMIAEKQGLLRQRRDERAAAAATS